MNKHRATLYRIARPILTLYMKVKYKPIVYGIENIPKSGAVIICGNHTNNLDCLLLSSCTKRTIYYLAKAELHKGFKKHFFRSVGTIPVDRSAKENNEAKNEAIDVLKLDKIIGIFPEGTINRTNDVIMPFKYGAVSMAMKTGATILPFAIVNKYIAYKKSVIVEFGKPYKVSSDNLELENNILMKKVVKLIKKNRKR